MLLQEFKESCLFGSGLFKALKLCLKLSIFLFQLRSSRWFSAFSQLSLSTISSLSQHSLVILPELCVTKGNIQYTYHDIYYSIIINCKFFIKINVCKWVNFSLDCLYFLEILLWDRVLNIASNLELVHWLMTRGLWDHNTDQ